VRLIIPANEDVDGFRKAWAKSLKRAPQGARIASLEELALARTKAKKPHAPGKPWETYADGTSPLWERWIMTSSCALIGQGEDGPTLLIVHGLPVAVLKDEEGTGGRRFALEEDVWSRLLPETPAMQRVPLDTALACRRGSPLAASAMVGHPLMRAAFGASLEAYAETHRAIAAEYLWHRMNHIDEYGRLSDEQRRLTADPPIVEPDFAHLADRANAVPSRGAAGWYLVLDNLQNMSMHEIPHGIARQCSLGLARPRDEAKFLVIVD